jgi:hypothetical protein
LNFSLSLRGTCLFASSCLSPEQEEMENETSTVSIFGDLLFRHYRCFSHSLEKCLYLISTRASVSMPDLLFFFNFSGLKHQGTVYIFL